MARLSFVALTLALVTTVHAQTLVSPAHYATEEGSLFHVHPFTDLSRFQQIDGSVVGTPMIIRSIAFRQDGRSATTEPMKVMTMTVRMATGVMPCSTTFASNYASPPQIVFQGGFLTPARSAARQSPTAFDVVVPLQTPYAYSGAAPLLWEIEVTSISSNARVFLDVAQSGFHLFTYGAYQMRGVGCTTANGVMEHRSNVQNQSFPPGINYYWETTGGPSSAQIALLLGIQSIQLPIACAPLWVSPLTSIAGTTDATGRFGLPIRTPDSPALHQLWIETQMAALDATQPVLPVAVSNGLASRAQVLAPPSFSACLVSALGSNPTTGSVINDRAVVVQFN